MPELDAHPLAAFDTTYRVFAKALRALHPVRQADQLLACTRLVAQFAAEHHPGRFADGAIENPLLTTGQALEQICRNQPTTLSVTNRAARRRVLHVATQIAKVGGHTRTIENWVTSDPDSRHYLFLTDQGNAPVRSELLDIIQRQDGAVFKADSAHAPVERALQLRRFAQSQADLVILHHHPYDVIPVVALATSETPPVALLNHADHIFWLGGSVADMVIQLRAISRELSRDRRGTIHDIVLPIPLAEDELPVPRAVARRNLGIPPERTVYLTIGRGNKYRSTSQADFFRTARIILDRVPNSCLIVLGVTADQVSCPETKADSRFYFLGEQPRSLEVRSAADVYLEGFPFGSQTAALEAGRSGLPLVLAYAPPTLHLSTNDECLWDIVPPTLTEHGYIERAVRLGVDLKSRAAAGAATKASVLQDHVADGWRQRLANVYAAMERITHQCHPVPDYAMLDTPADRELAAWQAQSQAAEADISGVVRGSAYHLRNEGMYAAAYALLLADLTSSTTATRSVLLALGKLGPHFLLREAQRLYGRLCSPRGATLCATQR